MVLDEKKTTVAFRCSECGSSVRSMVGVFALTADMMRLKCPCGGSDLMMVMTKDRKVRLTVPCLVCPTPHVFTVSAQVFYGRGLFALACPYSGLDLCFVGSEKEVVAASEASDRQLEEMLGDNTIADVTEARRSPFMTDPQIREIVTFVVADLADEGKIECKCPEGELGDYRAEVLDDRIVVRCLKCGAAAVIPANSFTAANDFLSVDHLRLE